MPLSFKVQRVWRYNKMFTIYLLLSCDSLKELQMVENLAYCHIGGTEMVSTLIFYTFEFQIKPGFTKVKILFQKTFFLLQLVIGRLAFLIQRMKRFPLEIISTHCEAPLASNSTTKGVFSRNFSLAQYKEIPFFCHHKSAKSGS